MEGTKSSPSIASYRAAPRRPYLEITDKSAAAFAKGFYTAIASGRAVDEAVSAGRIAILGTSDRTLEWLTPVLYLRGNQTQLFSTAAQSSDQISDLPVTEFAINEPGPWPLLINQLVSRLDLGNWNYHVGGLLRSSAGMRSSSKDLLLGLSIWLNGRILPVGQPELSRILSTLQKVTMDLLETFDLYLEEVDPGQDDPWLRTAKFYKIGGWRPSRSDEAELYDAHINLLSDLALELTRVVNWLCDCVRREFNPMFGFEQGVIQISGGPYMDAGDRWFRPEYSSEEMSSQDAPYETLEDFKSRRFSRDFHAEN